MGLQTLHIKYMCCQRCIEAVEATLTSLGLNIKSVQLGMAVFYNPNKVLDEHVKLALSKKGFEIIVSEEDRLTEEIKIAVIEVVHHSKNTDYNNKTLPAFLEKRTFKPFRLLNKVFLERTNMTIQKYAILQRIEKVKSLIEEDKANFSEIAYAAGYKTPQHLSAQFKKVVGVSMLEYKMKNMQQRVPIDKI